MIQNHRDLIVWQKAVDLAVIVYSLTEKLPKKETYNLCSQMNRASVSIGSNIAEGRARGTRNDFAQFLRMALGSCYELETQVIILKKLSIGKNLEYNKLDNLLEEIQRMLRAIISKLKSSKP